MRIIAQAENLPESYAAVEGVDTDAALAVAWQRIEHYIAWRFSPRVVVWRVESHKGEWFAPLAPVVAITIQVDNGPAYEPETGQAGGYMLPRGIVTVTATVGAGPVPEAVKEAVRRYARYMKASDKPFTGATRFGSGSFNASVRPELISPAMAMVNCGAADLLRAYRRV